MQFLHSREFLNAGDILVVNCSHQCNIFLADDNNFQNYKTGRSFRYHGGFQQLFPARFLAPSPGNWNIVLDLAGGSATVTHSIQIIRN